MMKPSGAWISTNRFRTMRRSGKYWRSSREKRRVGVWSRGGKRSRRSAKKWIGNSNQNSFRNSNKLEKFKTSKQKCS